VLTIRDSKGQRLPRSPARMSSSRTASSSSRDRTTCLIGRVTTPRAGRRNRHTHLHRSAWARRGNAAGLLQCGLGITVFIGGEARACTCGDRPRPSFAGSIIGLRRYTANVDGAGWVSAPGQCVALGQVLPGLMIAGSDCLADAINKAARQMSACRRKYALSDADTPRFFFCNAKRR